MNGWHRREQGTSRGNCSSHVCDLTAKRHILHIGFCGVHSLFPLDQQENIESCLEIQGAFVNALRSLWPILIRIGTKGAYGRTIA
jgi:hypothetical protein